MEQTISWFGLAWCVLPVAFICIIYFVWQGKVSDVLIANTRMATQLILIGYVLVFIFENPASWASVSILLLMVLVASWIAIRPVRHHRGFYLPALIALAVSVSVHLGISIFLVLDVDRWYEPRILIPLAGMYFANSMNAVSLSAERYHAELHDGKDQKKARITAFEAAMIPQINGLLAVGLVALPGMMTGQILSGVSPLIAVRYQILIMTMVLGTSGISSALMLWQLGRKKQLIHDSQ